MNYVAFIDNNGNNIRDKEEFQLENVIIKLGDFEVISDKSGKATMLNVKLGNYKLSSFSLDPVYGFYPRVPDSLLVYQSRIIYIPFSRAVQINGAVVLNKQSDDGIPVLLDNIRITAVDSSGNAFSTLTDKGGNYILYVPSGNYILTINDMIFGDNFVIAQNNIAIDLGIGISAINQSFIFNERPRKMIKKKF